MVGVAHAGREAIELARAREPDVILVDALMPGLDGFEVIRELRRAGAAAKAIVLSGGEPVEISEAALAARADAYVPKAAAHTLLLDAIHRLADDETAAATPDPRRLGDAGTPRRSRDRARHVDSRTARSRLGS